MLMDRSKKSRQQVPSGTSLFSSIFYVLEGKIMTGGTKMSAADMQHTQHSQSVLFQQTALEKAFLLRKEPVFKRGSRQDFRRCPQWVERPSTTNTKETGKISLFYILMLWCIFM